jgi:hypothetical protein
MAPKQSTTTSKSAGKRASTGAGSRAAPNKRKQTAPAEPEDEPAVEEEEVDDEEDEDEQRQKTIPPGLLTRLLHEFFQKEGTRITKDANAAVARFMDVFVREAIARSVAEREGGSFLEVSACGVTYSLTGDAAGTNGG